jgi:hypothetical protein
LIAVRVSSFLEVRMVVQVELRDSSRFIRRVSVISELVGFTPR